MATAYLNIITECFASSKEISPQLNAEETRYMFTSQAAVQSAS